MDEQAYFRRSHAMNSPYMSRPKTANEDYLVALYSKPNARQPDSSA
ncbi:MAG TPA: hypothetical protein PK447_01285 [Ignavibacteria bacterium]|nr:hypothetical protein [Ignavibacteria bacterium]